jgi:hypothetical protein
MHPSTQHCKYLRSNTLVGESLTYIVELACLC